MALMHGLEPSQIVRLEGDAVVLLDQRRLPDEEVELRCRSAAEVSEAIRTLAIRGAPAIGVAAAYGYALAALRGEDLGAAHDVLASSRPTAVNLAWALGEMRGDPTPERARAIHEAEVDRCRRMAAHAASLLQPGSSVLTHCNTGGLATGGYGTALGVVRDLNADGSLLRYPGSPLIARALMRGDDRLIVNELHPEDHGELKALFARDPQVKVMELDAWTAVKALLPPPERRGVTLIDPAFEETNELDRMVAALSEAASVAPCTSSVTTVSRAREDSWSRRAMTAVRRVAFMLERRNWNTPPRTISSTDVPTRTSGRENPQGLLVAARRPGVMGSRSPFRGSGSDWCCRWSR